MRWRGPGTFGDNIREARLGAGMAQYELAKALGVSPSYVCGIELSNLSPPLDVNRIVKMAAILGSKDPNPWIYQAARERSAVALRGDGFTPLQLEVVNETIARVVCGQLSVKQLEQIRQVLRGEMHVESFKRLQKNRG